MKTNSKMRDAMARDLSMSSELVASLNELLQSSFFEIDGCVLLGGLVESSSSASISDFPDRTGYECFVNSLHIDDFAEGNYLENAFFFLNSLFEKWRKFSDDRALRGIVSADEFGVVVKFHQRRENESWLSEDIEGYEDAILVVDSDEAGNSAMRPALNE